MQWLTVTSGCPRRDKSVAFLNPSKTIQTPSRTFSADAAYMSRFPRSISGAHPAIRFNHRLPDCVVEVVTVDGLDHQGPIVTGSHRLTCHYSLRAGRVFNASRG